MKLQENREIWINRINDFKASNLSPTAWAKNNGVNISAVRYWLRKLDANIVTTTNNKGESFEFASVAITVDDAISPIVIEINDVKLSITNNYDEVLLLKIINTLRKI